mmetsp:Transcript_974/g.2480  ORF Transcript_974/g.2480 Transcript_974/m.2480 type:complete len:364 (-) Transcript_974:121-1212(-)
MMSSQGAAFAVPGVMPARVLAPCRAVVPQRLLLQARAAGPAPLAGRSGAGALTGLAAALVVGRAASVRRRPALPRLRARGGEETHETTGEGCEVGEVALDAETLECLQGMWEDNVGLTIQVVGNRVHFNDGTGIWKISADGQEVRVRNTRLLGALPDLLHWETPGSSRWEWTRMDPLLVEDRQWIGAFVDYKTERLQLRRKLAAAVAAEDFVAASQLHQAWMEGSGLRPNTTLEHQARLLVGKHFIPGTPVKLRKSGARGVVIGCEPFVTAAAARRLTKEPLTAGQRLQPLYHCLVDSRFVAGDMTAFVMEHDLEVAEEFPLQGQGISNLMVPCPQIRAYVPGPKLEEALQRQRDGLPLVLWQ